MNRIFYMAVALLALAGCRSEKKPAIVFEKNKIYFSVTRNGACTTAFKFKNTGTDSLKILSADADCGCTGVDFPREGVLPGDSGLIRVVYTDSSEKDTAVVKRIVVQTNTQPSLHTLTLVGNVK